MNPTAPRPAVALPGPSEGIRLSDWRVMLTLGVLAPLGLFNTITVGDVPISLMWLAAAMGIWSGPPRLKGTHLLYLLLTFGLALKALLSGSAGTAVKFMTGVFFLLALSRVTYRDGLFFFKGLNALIPLSLLYAAYQWAIMLTVHDGTAFGATLPVEFWNSKGWHAVLTDTLDVPRASAFMFEPAYFAMILDTALAGELLYRQGRVRFGLIAQIAVGLILANSRTGIFAAVLIAASTWLVRRRHVRLLRTLAALAAIGPLFPMLFITSQLIDFSNNREAFDISVFARYISFAAFSQEDWKAILFGVLNYHDTFLNNSVFSLFSELLIGQGSDSDPKSFLATNLFQFGVVGSFVFYAGQIYLFRHSPRALALLASISIVFFNVYAYSWPLYWVVVCLTLAVFRRDLGLRRQAASTGSVPA